jgi:hypothetical protein
MESVAEGYLKPPNFVSCIRKSSLFHFLKPGKDCSHISPISNSLDFLIDIVSVSISIENVFDSQRVQEASVNGYLV